jgi:hypothetical protein
MILRAARISGWVLLVLATLTFAASPLLGTAYGLVDFLYATLAALALVALGSPTQRA